MRYRCRYIQLPLYSYSCCLQIQILHFFVKKSNCHCSTYLKSQGQTLPTAYIFLLLLCTETQSNPSLSFPLLYLPHMPFIEGITNCLYILFLCSETQSNPSHFSEQVQFPLFYLPHEISSGNTNCLEMVSYCCCGQNNQILRLRKSNCSTCIMR